MSFITVLIKKESKLLVSRAHYRNIINLLNNKLNEISLDASEQSGDEFDAGFIFIDLDSRKILSYQNGFGIHNLTESAQDFLDKDFEFIDLYI